MQLQPYLFFDGRCEEAIEFYKQALGAEVQALMRFKESPEPHMAPPGSGEKVMHSNVRIGNVQVMMSDGQCLGKATFQGFALTLSVANAAEADRVFHALEAGGQVQMPLTQTFFSERFGMVADKFGVSWMVLVYKG